MIEVRRFEDYEKKLRSAHVVLDAKERRDIIRNALAQQAFALRLEPIEDEGLLDEVAGLAEWPVVLIGSIPDEFMDLPPEILRTSMRAHQKYFSLRYPPLQSGGGGSPRRGETEGARLAPKFAMVANMVARDGGKEIVAGNERVLRARLSDAKFFWDQDRKRTLESRVEDLKGVVFHAKLGTQHERVERIVALAGEIAAKIGADVEKAKRAALLCKADLTTGMVGEFPELQGVMGSYYALHDGEDVEVADAVRDHYKPVGPSDAVPTNKISVAVAIADKMDQLVGFFAVDERPTGSGDPYALRRAALGMIRLILSLQLRLRYREILLLCFWESVNSIYRRNRLIVQRSTSKQFELFEHLLPRERIDIRRDSNLQNNDAIFVFQGELDLSRKRDAAVLLQAGRPSPETLSFSDAEQVNVALMDFLADRLKVALREKGTRHDLIDAVFSLGSEDDLVRLVARVEALQTFLKTDDGANLLTAYRRAANILKAEEKKDKTTFDGEPDASLLALPEEKALGEALASASKSIAADVAAEKFVEAMGVMAKLRTPVDAFFDKVTVNDKNPKLRENRLRLLARLRATLHQVADFSKIEG
ncbi:MAG TPA: glycine--tRNA ligase subunit beta [Caulobacterales bacterium]|nr:glycine--tRNA ligase subunit beta [Caulobacterales bacterium]